MNARIHVPAHTGALTEDVANVLGPLIPNTAKEIARARNYCARFAAADCMEALGLVAYEGHDKDRTAKKTRRVVRGAT